MFYLASPFDEGPDADPTIMRTSRVVGGDAGALRMQVKKASLPGSPTAAPATIYDVTFAKVI